MYGKYTRRSLAAQKVNIAIAGVALPDGGDFSPGEFGQTAILFRLGDFGDTQDLFSSS